MSGREKKRERKKKKRIKEYRIDDGAIANDHRQFVQYNTKKFPLGLKEEAGTNRYRLTSFLKKKKLLHSTETTHTQQL